MISEEALLNLNPGDKVKVIDDLESSTPNCYAVPAMIELAGKVVTVEAPCNDDRIGQHPYVKIRENGFCWTRFCFDSVVSAIRPVGVAELI